MRIKFPLLIIACCLLLMACGHKNTQKNYQAYYSFNNVTTSTQEKQLAKALKSKGIPTKDWNNLAPYITRYNQENTNLQPVVKKWTKSKIGKDQNQFVTFLNEKTFEDNEKVEVQLKVVKPATACNNKLHLHVAVPGPK